jgi:PAS domain S-box-containing protein
MTALFNEILDTNFTPHAVCLRVPSLVWLHAASDGLIALAYLLIPVGLFRLAQRRKDLSFHWILLLFAAFILSCGATHIFSVATLWIPIYRLEGLLKLLTAAISLATAVLFNRFIPRLAALPTPEQWRLSKEELNAQSAARRQAEEKIDLLAVLDSLPQIVWTATPAGDVDYYNQRWQDYTGMNIEQSKAWGWQPALHPDDLKTTVDRWTQSFTLCNPFEIELRLKRASDNAYRWHVSRALPIRDAHGSLVRWFGTCTDIEDFKRSQTEVRILNEGLAERVRRRTAQLAQANRQLAEANLSLEQAEQSDALLASIVASSDDAIISETLQGVITSWNGGAERLFGYTAREAIGGHVSLIIPADGLEAEKQLLKRLSESAVVEHLETTRLLKDGQTVPVSLTVSPVRDANGQIIGASKILRDVSKALQAQQEILLLNRRLEQAAAAAETANLAKSTFLSTMSHEIRTPLNAILGYAQLMLRDKSLGTESKANLNVIGRSGEHLLALINDILDMSKIEAGHTQLNPTTFNLSHMLDDLAAMFRLRAEAKALHFAMVVDGEPVSYVIADEGKIRQALINLLGNAIKFTKRGHVHLHVHLTPKNAHAFWLSAAVEDTGIGITPEDQAHLFEPFTQVKGKLNIQEGTGLGLAISRKCARLMGGDLTAVSSPGIGSTFTFEIPVERGHAGVAVKSSNLRRVKCLRAGTGVPRILVADDHLENQDWLMKLLSAIGYSVQAAETGEAAIRRWEEWRPNMVLMDIHMPVMDGLEATRRIKADPRGRDTAILVLTASALEEDRQTVADGQADGFLTKPCREEELLEKMRALLHVDYEYEEEGAFEGPIAPTTTLLTPLPADLAERLRDAISDGNKKLLDKLILQVRHCGDTASAGTLQELADRYDYDALTLLLEQMMTPRQTT